MIEGGPIFHTCRKGGGASFMKGRGRGPYHRVTFSISLERAYIFGCGKGGGVLCWMAGIYKENMN